MAKQQARSKGGDRGGGGGGSKKERSVQFRVDDDQLDALERAARREGDSLGNWCRRNLLQKAGWQYQDEA